MTDYLAHGFLFFSNGPFIIPLLIFGLLKLDRTIFYHAACLLCLSIIVNVALKVSFQIPLHPSLGKKGFAFPSGHMQLSTVFYTWLMCKFHKRWLNVLTVFLLSGIGLSLIHFNYHTLVDVIGGLFFAFLLLIIYHFSLLKWPEKTPWFGVLITTCLLLYIHARYTPIANYVWKAYYILWGLIVGSIYGLFA